MYSIFICDADERARISLEKSIRCYFKAKSVLVDVRKFESFDEMVRHQGIADIVFMDEDTVGSEGMKQAKLLQKFNPDLYLYVLGDGYRQLDCAMDLHVFRYLEKPVDIDRLYLSFNIILSSHEEIHFMSKYFPVTLKEDELVCVYSYERRTYVVTDIGKVYPTTISIKEWEQKLSRMRGFSHPHYSYIINMRYIQDFNGKRIILHCMNGKNIRIVPSQRKIGNFRNDYYSRMRVH